MSVKTGMRHIVTMPLRQVDKPGDSKQALGDDIAAHENGRVASELYLSS